MSRHHNYDTLYIIANRVTPIGTIGIGVDGLVNWANPCLSHMLGWQYERVSDFCWLRRWTLEVIDANHL